MKKLDLKQMEKLQGGVPVEEYCKTLGMIIKHNWDDMSEESQGVARLSYLEHCL